ncbi:inositol 2-dehydrogenase [Alicyclobacillus macrosporangiidus]|uniref:inositol 2-dehydrogenase n=1 Tax=Alicyclobacillus macrosporangiidus TaxID=392015 RepID=UPI000690F502|nr:inositol 2-dehydrogenase [Alicyclobacillus macrosporangiidus]
MPADVRCAVLGLGRLGYRHAVNLATKVRGAKVTAVADAIPAVAERVARELDVAVWTTNPDELIERDDVDAVVVVTPTDTHAEYAQRVARAGKALFLEKPLTLDVDQALETVAVVQRSGILCQLGFMRRFDPAYAHARARIAAGDIGRPLYFKAVSRDPSAPPEAYVAVSGGIYLDQSIHDYDIARFLMGDEITEVTALGSVLYSTEVAKYGDVDQALTYVRFAGGGAGDIEAYRNAFYGYDIRAEVLGTEGAIVVSGLQHHQVKLLGKSGAHHDIVPGFIERFETAYVAEMEHFIDCVRNNVRPGVGVEDGYAALAVGIAARESYREGGRVQVQHLPEALAAAAGRGETRV